MRCLVLAAIIMSACADYPDVIKVCVNRREDNEACATGFFVAPDTVVTARHVLDKSCDDVLTLIGPGIDETVSYFRYKPPNDYVEGVSPHDITGNIMPVCNKLVIGAEVVALGNPTRWREPKELHGELIRVVPETNKLFLSLLTEPGFSGGPVIDVEQGCVIGSVIGHIESAGQSTAVDLVHLE